VLGVWDLIHFALLDWSGLGRWRWVVERTVPGSISFAACAGGMASGADIREGFLSLGCALICWQSLRKRWAAA